MIRFPRLIPLAFALFPFLVVAGLAARWIGGGR
jgi:hypothetical protein